MFFKHVNPIFLFVFFLFISNEINAQKYTPGFFSLPYNIYSDSTAIGLHSSVATCKESFETLDFQTRFSFNSAYPRGYNDGPVWKGKGITTEVHAGVAGKKGKFSFQLMPVLFFSQNTSFNLAPRNNSINSPYAYQFSNQIDWVQKFGDGSKLFFHPGQSELKFQTGKFIAAVSTQNYSFGPSVFNPILISYQAGGFPHLRLGSEPFILHKKIGKLEVNYIAGLLKESDYFDENEENDDRFLNSLFISFQPSFLKSLKLGFGRVLYKQTQFFEIEDLLSPIYILEDTTREGLRTGNDTFDQIASVFIDWSFPQVGFRAYAEFAKNDFTGRTRGTIVEPEHSRGYTIGFEKRITTKKNHNISITYEHTNLSRNQAWLWRATPPFYTHGLNRQGYTNNGQVIGAGIGTGGNSDQLLLNIRKKNNDGISFLIQRIEHNRDYFVTNIQNEGEHDIEYSFGSSLEKKIKTITLLAEAIISHNFKRYYIDDETNLYLTLGMTLDL